MLFLVIFAKIRFFVENRTTLTFFEQKFVIMKIKV